jgi:hypothetical protein
MTLTCQYCQSPCAADLLKCPNCSAPIPTKVMSAADYRHCPFCRRVLLALGSPACNYCGRRLPEEYIKAREGDLQRLTTLDGHTPDPQLSVKLETILRQTARRDHRESSLADLFDITDPADLFK